VAAGSTILYIEKQVSALIAANRGRASFPSDVIRDSLVDVVATPESEQTYQCYNGSYPQRVHGCSFGQAPFLVQLVSATDLRSKTPLAV